MSSIDAPSAPVSAENSSARLRRMPPEWETQRHRMRPGWDFSPPRASRGAYERQGLGSGRGAGLKR
jgi:hypothetical protein